MTKKSKTRQNAESLALTIFVALTFRAFVAEAYSIPSGSMIPTLQVGDRIFVNKFVYGLRVPLWGRKFGARSPSAGEVIVFVHPKTGDDLIKRVAAVAGDTVELRGGELWVNGVATARRRSPEKCGFVDYDEHDDCWWRGECDAWHETLGKSDFTTLTLPGRGSSTTPPVRVPDGHVFVLGDNRDNSSDSRYWGFVPLDHIKGRAMFVWWSGGSPDGVRWRRLGHAIE